MENDHERLREQKLGLMAVLIEMAKSDEKIHDHEVAFIAGTAQKLGLVQEDLKPVWKSPEAYFDHVPGGERERMQFFLYALSMMCIDEKVDEDERQVARKIGFSLGIREALCEDLIEIFEQDIHGSGNPEAISAAILKYSN